MKNYLNISKHILSDFFERLALDKHFYASHISLVMALFYYCDTDAPYSPFQVSRPKLMRFARIKSIATYHKNLNDLVAKGYIEYKPSWHPQRGSQIRFLIENSKL